MSDEVITIPKSSRRRPLPEAGLYGPGLQWEADLELFSLEKTDRNPGYDREGEFAPYYTYTWRISMANGPQYFVREDLSHAANSGSRALDRLAVVGCPMEDTIDPETGEEASQFNLQEAAPRKFQGGIEMAEPRSYTNQQGEERTVHGRILRVFGAE